MPIDYDVKPPNQIRRQDKAQNDACIRSLLHRVPYCTIATVYEEQPFVNTNLFVYDEAKETIYFHTAKVGRTRTNVETDGQACLSISEMGRLLPHEEALEFSVEYRGVTVFGQISIIEESETKRYALQMLLDKYFGHLKPRKDYRAITHQELVRTSVCCLVIDSWSGKALEAPADYPGSFIYGNPPQSM